MKKTRGILLSLFLLTVSLGSTSAQAPALSDSASYTWILLPDPQTYQKFGRNQSLFTLMIDWIRDQKDELNIQMAVCVGDLVEQNNITEPDGKNGDQTSKQQWESVSAAFSRLDGVLPYIVATGNHDYGIKNAENRQSQLNKYFLPDGNPLTRDLLVEMAPNGMGMKTLENACYEWKSPHGQSFLLFSLEFGPRKEILEWAESVAARPEYKEHVGVVVTHSYLNSENERIVQEKYRIPGANYGETIWNELIQPSDNFRFVFCGHIAASATHRGHVGYRMDKNTGNKTVHQMLFNAQREGGDWHGNGGDGWLRILEFLPDGKTVKVYTFSPFFFISPSMRHLAWRTENYDQFDISY